MYRVAVRRDFVAQHYLIGGDWGLENKKHSHHYVLELELEGADLDRHGYLVDIVEIETALNQQVGLFRDYTLNELEAFKELNPSLERFAHILCENLAKAIRAGNIGRMTVRLWENENAWASYTLVK
jgi:6-pyruvoyltetrahydropterin/6-carboxytetrahydropterin synthase